MNLFGLLWIKALESLAVRKLSGRRSGKLIHGFFFIASFVEFLLSKYKIKKTQMLWRRGQCLSPRTATAHCDSVGISFSGLSLWGKPKWRGWNPHEHSGF